MLRTLCLAAAFSASSAIAVWAQPPGAPPTPPPVAGGATVQPNAFEANKPVAAPNKIVKAIPLSIEAQRNALANIDKSITEQARGLSDKIRTILPDELAILAKTDGWVQDNQQALVVALRAGDPAAVYQAWAKGNPKDTAGGEIAARHTEVKRLATNLLQDVEKNKSAVRQVLSDLDAALGKVAGATPAVSDLAPLMKSLRTAADARHLIASVTPQRGGVAVLPTGDNSTLIFDPSLAVGTLIVLNSEAMLIGHEGAGPLAISTGNAAQALGLPIVTTDPIPELQGSETVAGTLLTNPASSQGTVHYNVNGTHYVMQPGMKQFLHPGHNWVVEYDRGQNFGKATYKLEPGTFWFTPTENGWQLFKHRFDVVLDNTQSSQEFNFLFQGQKLSVPAAATRTVTSAYPIVVKFDRGNGAEFVTKAMPFSGNVQIGVNSQDNLWDLFPTVDNRREAAQAKSLNTPELKSR